MSADGLTLLANSSRSVSEVADIWMFTRKAVDQPFTTVERLATPVSTSEWDMPHYISNDRCFVIASTQAGNGSTLIRNVRYFTRRKATEAFGPGIPLGIPSARP